MEELVGSRPIDLLKVDIEGSEYELIVNYPDLLRRVQHLMIEIHTAPDERQNELMMSLGRLGLNLVAEPLKHSGYQLAMFERS